MRSLFLPASAKRGFTLRSAQGKRSAFTLIELLVVLGILGILAAIVITAVAPSRQLTAATDAWRRSASREILNAITQYVIEEGSLPGGVPVGSSNALPICRQDHAGETSCVDLDILVTDDYITALPVDSAETNADLIGFTVYQAPQGFVTVDASYLGVTGQTGGTTGTTGGGATGGGGGDGLAWDLDDLGDVLLNDVAVQDDGKIVVAGTKEMNASDSHFVVARLNADGTLDTGFNTVGYVDTGIVAGDSEGKMVALQSDGKILLYVNSYSAGWSTSLLRFNTDGSYDDTIFSSGEESMLVTSPNLVVQPDDKIIIGGSNSGCGGYCFRVLRRNADGTADTTFNGTGERSGIAPLHTNDYLWAGNGSSMFLQGDGKIVLAAPGYDANVNGSGQEYNAVIRLNADGTLDTSFSGDGKNVVTALDKSELTIAMTVLQDGRIVTAGVDNMGNNDATFVFYPAVGGGADTDSYVVGDATSIVYDMVALSDDDILASVSTTQSSLGVPALVRLNSDGSLDTGFQTTGIATFPQDANAYVAAMAVDGSAVYMVGYIAGSTPGTYRPLVIATTTSGTGGTSEVSGGNTGGTGGSAAVCGDTVIEDDETCDDGNTDDNDGCDSDCHTEVCGNGYIQNTEICDDGDTDNGDGCNSACTEESGFSCLGEPSVCATTCGDGVPAGSEACDDNDTDNGDGCSATCTVESGYNCSGTPSSCSTTCGDNIVAGSEACDDGTTTGGDGCSSCSIESGWYCVGSPSVCTTTCGDNITAGTEQCDMGGPADGIACDIDCTNVSCGDAHVNAAAGEACDDGNGDNTDACVNCDDAVCGDGYTRSGVEECDSGAGDVPGCDSDCTTPVCGDGHTNISDGETCDDGNTSNGDSCAGSCRCGNGSIDSGEQCDDLNQNDGDGCDSDCQTE